MVENVKNNAAYCQGSRCYDRVLKKHPTEPNNNNKKHVSKIKQQQQTGSQSIAQARSLTAVLLFQSPKGLDSSVSHTRFRVEGFEINLKYLQATENIISLCT